MIISVEKQKSAASKSSALSSNFAIFRPSLMVLLHRGFDVSKIKVVKTVNHPGESFLINPADVHTVGEEAQKTQQCKMIFFFFYKCAIE